MSDRKAKKPGASGVPARGYSWPPFEKGHTLSMKAGAASPRTVNPLAAELVQAVTDAAERPGSPISYLADFTFRFAVEAWAYAEVRCHLIRSWLEEHGGLAGVTDEGEPLPIANHLRLLEGQAMAHRERLGLDPLARARLGRDVAVASVDLARLMARFADELEEGGQS